jgi:L-fuconolactonase
MAQPITLPNVVDAQIHVWEDDSLRRPWVAEFARTRQSFLGHGIAVTADRAVAAMDAVGVAAALVTSFGIYDDIDYAVRSVHAFPDRLGLVTQIDVAGADPAAQARAYSTRADVLAFRMSFLSTDRAARYEAAAVYERLATGEFDPLFVFAAERGVPVMLVVTGHWPLIERTAHRHPDTAFVIDHLGMVQGPDRVPSSPRFVFLDDVLRLGRQPNVQLKLSGTPALSTEGYPFRDVWLPVRRIVDTFGAERVFWGSDFGRTRPSHTYADAVGYLLHSDLLTPQERRMVMGESLRRFIGWPDETIQRPTASKGSNLSGLRAE